MLASVVTLGNIAFSWRLKPDSTLGAAVSRKALLAGAGARGGTHSVLATLIAQWGVARARWSVTLHTLQAICSCKPLVTGTFSRARHGARPVTGAVVGAHDNFSVFTAASFRFQRTTFAVWPVKSNLACFAALSSIEAG